jgi:hypothetical protein
MQIRKTYKDISPTLLYNEIKDFVLKQGLIREQDKMETYSIPGDSSSFIHRGTLTFTVQGKEALRAHIIGSEKTETKLMLDSVDELFPAKKITELQEDLTFMLGSFENPK